MAFENLTENPQDSTIVLTIVGLFLAQGLNAVNAGLLGRILIYLGEVVALIAVLTAAKEAEENTLAKQVEATKENKITTVSKEDAAKTDGDNIREIISELQQRNQYLQDQIWALQEELLRIQNKQ
ncbi:hypothetical protein [Pelosinus sp. UFO1]|uniref:hypothetical protein n=1 Tax=Pelosinus sp. UFO1 TaxID=484770 RepID=UPI0004D1EF83|nr:hypothetical protein [Pelosinus sp. UFO1]AIF50770.1 hypothetical protein UFO1_1215 [Pelosinus sp. UFO1]